jgi:hypothetical protein
MTVGKYDSAELRNKNFQRSKMELQRQNGVSSMAEPCFTNTIVS